MDWHLAGYDSHPIDGDAASVASLAAHLVTLTGEVRSHTDQLSALDSSDIWESTSGSADDFREVVGDLPQKLELVATRYEAVSATLDGFHPVLASTKQEAEYWIQEAAAAQAEVERAEGGIELMVDHERNAEQVADTTNAERQPGEPEVEPEPWSGEDYHATLTAAQADLAQAVANVQSAVQEFRESGDSGAQAILDAANDALAQRDGWFSDIFAPQIYGFRPDEGDPGGIGTVIPTADTDPDSVAEWWASLSEETRQRLIDEHYAELGKLRGLPAMDLDQINRKRLEEDVPRLRTYRDQLDVAIAAAEERAAETGDFADEYYLAELRDERARVQTELENADKIRKQMADLDSKHPPGPKPYLLTYFYQDSGRFAVALGNPDTAAHTAVVVPGTGHDVRNEGGLFGPVSEGERLYYEMYGQVNPHGGPPSTPTNHSVIVWMGTDMPDEPFPNAVNPTYGDSEHGGGRLRDDIGGYQAAHRQTTGGTSSGHTTIVAHSYGSYMSGEAINSGMVVSDFVNIGSPGLTAPNVHELGKYGMNHHVWAAEAKGDIVPDIGPPVYPNPPTKDANFGAETFDVSDSTGHSEYYKEDSHSLKNIASIALGRYNEVEPGAQLPVNDDR